ncbi:MULTISPECIES: bifunctional ADP-dependent NAD(P)H-hydrate dehydratase/NAD(P)H-hydrate epimerase [unclassified Brenneria]|uniref:bifunctional ADP-dependent NAD(P)H-hydrate dehydratase/NAD(P)H-hydrate epimerase n=1 Tax=unclassified Brenneria TaxID=2634434 RepID=UPI0029C36520|nr:MULTISPECIES: bifunctional ADP-dependent NAD(P)H-hydrate dehydratase/NAD(P)H-hydrate epimerase [unclassified Brenneria]MDX5629060.1 bifunctional ADP-dependent NAD(P)H-hydrate dehydratase/NAD(P)H-hydrate epimerase [Brenneria sp. L3-3Z]MDX5696199.1 bifunctional ADP-dependent NAD(P)H-hydrate dehydratase/NAD(P)H-hydrate epimerase [Brenneria sp. L4-2C]MEE3660952.1 bifunctional ADP-dependent NAD(P)H-hydrate dehydratase/NAD(P)H-hydrate epimerase [Brenneria sp. g21c3]
MTDGLTCGSDFSLPQTVFQAQWVRREEANAARESGVSLYELMRRAGQATFQIARQYYPTANHWLILAGHGNNGGDGYVVASLAQAAGITPYVIACTGDRDLPAEAHAARQAWLDQGGTIQRADAPWPDDIDLIIDALLGTGLSNAPRSPYDELITQANAHSAPVVAIDIPSGLNAETGQRAGNAVHAEHTVTFIALKPGLLTGKARDCVGRLHYNALGLSEWMAAQAAPIRRLSAISLTEWLKPRRPDVHKGDNGRLLIVGGDYGMGGAVFMAGEAALRSGAGLVRVLTHKEYLSALLTVRPELMVRELTADNLRQGLEWADVVAIGPGLGQDEWGKNALRLAENCNKPMLWDADALNLLAIDPHKRQNRVLTPHPGEAARLLNCRVSDIESDRLLAVQKLVKRYGGVVVLKGAGTVIAGEQGQLAIADVGNPGMATGGMGDVLSGIIGGLLAQKLSLYDAACAGCVVHGASADWLAARRGTRGMLATDLMPVLSRYVNPESIPLEKTE